MAPRIVVTSAPMERSGVTPLPVRYLAALLATAVALAVRWLLDPWLGSYTPYATLYGAVAASVWVGGVGPALVSVALGYMGSEYLFVRPHPPLAPQPFNVIALAAYLTSCGIIVFLGSAVRAARERAQQLLQDLRTAIASIGDAVIATDTDGRVEWLNPAAEALTGWKQPEAVGRPLPEVFSIIDEKTRLPVESPVRRALREGTGVAMADHTLLVTREGVEKPIDDSAAPIRQPAGEVTGCILVFRDTSEKRRAEAERSAYARLLASIVETSDEAIVSKSIEGVIQTWNAAAERLFGYRAEEVIGRHVTLLIPEDRFDEEEGIMQQLRSGQRVDTFETVRLHKDGRFLEVALTISPLKDETGRVVGASKIARDVTARKKTERRIEGLLAKLREEDRRKDVFLATLAHEIRGPLAPIRNSLEILKRAPAGSPNSEPALGAMDRQLSQVERLVDDLLDLSRITHNRLELRRLRMVLGPAVEQAVEACRPLADRLGQTLELEAPPGALHVHADAARLTQVVANVVNNACKYTPPGGRIRVSYRAEGREAVVSVKDDGVGIDPDMLGLIFEPFAQAETAGRSHGGLGIGLALVKELVEMHDGAVEAMSDGPGRGSEFVIRLPLVEGELRALPAGDPEVQASPPPALQRLLVVDDNKDSADSLGLLLNILGHETRTAYDGPSALATAEAFRPEVVILDLGMPNMDGFETCRRLRQLPGGERIVVVALTGWGQEQDRRASGEAGFDFHLVKPVDPSKLSRLLAEIGEAPARGAGPSPVDPSGPSAEIRHPRGGQGPAQSPTGRGD